MSIKKVLQLIIEIIDDNLTAIDWLDSAPSEPCHHEEPDVRKKLNAARKIIDAMPDAPEVVATGLGSACFGSAAGSVPLREEDIM